MESLEFHRTSEGRQFLREMYKVYLRGKNPGNRKVAMIVSDINHVRQSDEEEMVRGALKRWAEGQADLWSGDREKTTRVTARLETLLMSEPEIRDIMLAKASSDAKVAIGQSLSHLYFGFGDNRIPEGQLKSVLEKADGLYRELSIYPDLDGMDSFWDGNRHLLLHKPDGHDFLLAKEFVISTNDKNGSQPIFHDVYSGFAFPLPNGAIHRTMISHIDLGARFSDFLEAVDLRKYHEDLDPKEANNRGYRVRRVDFRIAPDDGASSLRDRFIYPYSSLLRKVSDESSRFIKKIAMRSVWDIPL